MPEYITETPLLEFILTDYEQVDVKTNALNKIKEKIESQNEKKITEMEQENSHSETGKEMVVFSEEELKMEEELLPIEQITSDVIREKYPKLSKENAINELDKLIKLWLTEVNSSSTLEEVLRIGLCNFGMTRGKKEISMDNIQKGYKHCIYQVLTLYNYFRSNKIIKEKHPETKQEYFIIFSKLLEIIYYTEQTVRGGIRMRIVLDPDYESTMNDDIGLFRFNEINLSDNSPYQNLVLFLLRKLYENQWRRYKEYVYCMIFNEKGQFTYSWKEKMTIKQFVHKCTNKEGNYKMWHNATKNKSNIRDAIDYLENCDSAEFPELKKERRVFSFKNGVYIINHFDKETGKHVDYWHEYGTQPKLPSSKVACRHFDVDFNNYPEIEQKDWENIPTPHFDKIINYQYKKEEQFKDISRWMYIFIGKMLYEVGQLERWQIMPYLHGSAGTGKSSICEVIKGIYESKDVGVIENTIEEKFGLAPLCDKYIFIAPEVKKNFSLDQALFQKIISGEEVCLPKKNKDPVQVTWNLPGFMASNEAPGFIDASGSISRRLLVFKFTQMITADQIDPDLILKLRKEIPALIKKCNMAYLDTVNTYSSKDIWSIVPTYFHETREALGRDTNPLKSFLGSGLVRFGKEFYIKEKEFKDAFKEYCAENNLGRPRWNESLYEEPFSLYGNKYSVKIKIKKDAGVDYPRINPTKRKFNGLLLTGVELNTRLSDEGEDVVE